MPFPDSQRVIYNRNPLKEVICQLRFPTILKISKELPSDFQDVVRGDYPNFVTKSNALPVEIPPDIRNLFSVSVTGGNKVYNFISENGDWTVGLSQDFLSLSSQAYTRWEEFKERLIFALHALLELYRPYSFSRIGLRYIDLIDRAALNLEDCKWSELISPHIAGELSTDVADEIEELSKVFVLKLERYNSNVRVRHGIAEDEGNHRQCYLIDADFFTNGKTEVSDGEQVIDYFNWLSGRLFRWCITNRLHQAMEPQAITDKLL